MAPSHWEKRKIGSGGGASLELPPVAFRPDLRRLSGSCQNHACGVHSITANMTALFFLQVGNLLSPFDSKLSCAPYPYLPMPAPVYVIVGVGWRLLTPYLVSGITNGAPGGSPTFHLVPISKGGGNFSQGDCLRILTTSASDRLYRSTRSLGRPSTPYFHNEFVVGAQKQVK